MDDLVTWLRSRLDEDERVAQAAEGSCWHVEYCDDGMAGFHDHHDPARVLAEVKAKRAIVDWIDGELADDAAQQMPWELACHLAAVYADREGYRDEWRPSG